MGASQAESRPSEVVLDPERLAELEATGLLDAGAQPALERFTRLACALVGAPVAAVSLVTDDRQYFPAFTGMSGQAADDRQTPISHSFCQHVVSDGILDVPDAREHPVLRDNPAAAEGGGIRAYLGVPLVSGSGQTLGALCTTDGETRVWSAADRAIMEDLAAAVSTDIQLRLAAAANGHLATHDALTGLANRRRLDEDLAAALVPGAPLSLLALLDLDGFKSYNDAFGHPAGDDLLRRIAGRLREHSLEAGGAAYRMGGDEFCLLVPTGTDVAAIAGAVAERTGPYDITASFGVVLLGSEAQTAVDALHLVDERLYSHKYCRTGGSADHACAALLQALAERHPTLGRHAEAVDALAEATSRRLGLAESELTDVRLTARLHDVGKVAIPDSILDKPAALDEGEWSLVRRHTIIGERILAATPALKHIAPAVRSSHERWDGAGYPDGLEGRAIPLVARIVAAADAYDAMTADRPYRAPRSHEAALAELGRCSGSQFDPDVVAALELVLSDR